MPAHMPIAKLTITVSVTKARWDEMSDAEMEAEGDKIDAELSKVSSYAEQLLGDKYHVEVN